MSESTASNISNNSAALTMSQLGDSSSAITTASMLPTTANPAPSSASKMSTFVEKMFITSIPNYSRAEAANPIEWSWNLIQQINRTAPSESTKEFAIRSKVDNNTLLQIDSMLRENTPRPTRWNPAWHWPVRITDAEPLELWVCRRIVEAAYGDHRISHFVSQLKPTPQQPDESTSLYQLRINNTRDINSFVASIAGHLYSVPDAVMIDQYLCKEYKPSIQTRVTRMISDLAEEQKRLRPHAPPYIPTVDDYRNAALQAEEALLDFDTMINERGGSSLNLNLSAQTATAEASTATNSILALVRPVSLNPPAANPPTAATGEEKSKSKRDTKAPGTPSEQSWEKRLNKLAGAVERLAKNNNKKRNREEESDEERPPKRRGGQTMLPFKAQGRQGNPGCYNCKSTDHRISDCNQPCRPEITCPHCKKKGHFARNCNQRNGDAAMPRNGVAEIADNAQA